MSYVSHYRREYNDSYNVEDAYADAVIDAYEELEDKWRKENCYQFAENILWKITDISTSNATVNYLLSHLEEFVKGIPTEILDDIAPTLGITSLTKEAEKLVNESQEDDSEYWNAMAKEWEFGKHFN